MKAEMIREAEISQCGKYRYTLGRRWGERPGSVTWIMLNPSTADAEKDDPTIRRCISFTKRFGYDELVVVNLFAFRATHPLDLELAQNPVGPENPTWVKMACDASRLIVTAWGVLHHLRMPMYMEMLQEVLKKDDRVFNCLGVTKDGHPRHPLYVKGDTPLEVWPRT